MEGDKTNISTISVPATMSDITLLSTPLPQAASTATKRHSIGNDDESKFWSTSDGLAKDQLDGLVWLSQRHLSVEKPQSDLELLVNEFDSLDDFNFRVPSVPSRFPNSQKKTNSDFNSKDKPLKKHSCVDSVVKRNSVPKNVKTTSVATTSKMISAPIGSKMISIPSSSNLNQAFPKSEILFNAPEKLSTSYTSSKVRSTRDPIQYQDDRASVASSANSSLGVISSEVLDEAQRQPLIDLNQDLSLRLAQQLNLDSSQLKGDIDISSLVSERSKEKLAAKSEDKENRRSGRSSSDYWTIHGYSSDNSRNNTAKRLSSLSSGSETESSDKLAFSGRTSLRPLSENNFSSSLRTSNSNSSVSYNPFGSYSNVSVGSEDFQCAEDAMQRLERDERQFSIGSTRSLSGIYGDTSTAFSVNGEKLSMSSFLRSGSGPLGCLDSEGDNSQRPQFGMSARSPEKTGRPKAILPPPQDKSTFVLDEEPVRDTPWAPHSLMEQFSNIHNADGVDADTSVPSLSYISMLLENLQEGANPQDILAQLMASKDKPKENPDKSLKSKRISSVVEGENSFCQGVDVVQRSFASRDKSALQHSVNISVDNSATTSACNITDFEGDEEACACVMTPQSMDFDVFNELSCPVEYRFTRACYVDGQRKDSAAYVHFPVSKLVLFPGQRRTLTISIAALVGGVIKIKIEVARKNPLTQARECSYVYGKIIAEIPRVSLLTQHKGEMVLKADCEFNKIYQHTIIMKNEGRSTVPLKLTVTETTHDDVTFHFGEREKRSVTVMVEPGQTTSQLVQCETPSVFAHQHSPDTIIPVEARVDFCLATTDLYQLSPVAPVTLGAPLKPNFFGAPSRLLVPSVLTLFNSYDHPVMLKTVNESRYTVHPSSVTVPPREIFMLSIGMTDMKNLKRCGELTLHSLNPQAAFTIKLENNCRSSLSSNSSLATPHSSRAASPTSPSSYGGPVEELRISCSTNQLVWGSCPLHQKLIKTFCLKNAGRLREKLRLTVSGTSTCFKIVNEDDTLQSELKLSLQPMENREIKVAVLPTVAGPKWGLLTISRISCPADKNVMPLHAFGGKAKVKLTESIFEIGGNKFVFLNEKTLQSSIVLSNSGESSAFFKISEANVNTSLGLSILPHENVLSAGHTATVHIGLSVNAERIEFLLQQTTPYVQVAQLNICFGDESTRQRLLQMQGVNAALAARVATLSRIPTCPIPDLDKLDGSPVHNGAEKMWHEDTDECSVGVFIKRSALEAIRLDTSVNFVDLSTTVSKQH